MRSQTSAAAAAFTAAIGGARGATHILLLAPVRPE